MNYSGYLSAFFILVAYSYVLYKINFYFRVYNGRLTVLAISILQVLTWLAGVAPTTIDGGCLLHTSYIFWIACFLNFWAPYVALKIRKGRPNVVSNFYGVLGFPLIYFGVPVLYYLIVGSSSP